MKLSSKRRSMASRNETTSPSAVKRAMVINASSLELNATLALAISWRASAPALRHPLDTRREVPPRGLLGLSLDLGRELVEELGRLAQLQQELDTGEGPPTRLREIADRAHA